MPNVNPDHGYTINIAIDDSLKDLGMVCFQAALLYTSSRGEIIGRGRGRKGRRGKRRGGEGGRRGEEGEERRRGRRERRGEEERRGRRERRGEEGEGSWKRKTEWGEKEIRNWDVGRESDNGVGRMNSRNMKPGMEKEEVRRRGRV